MKYMGMRNRGLCLIREVWEKWAAEERPSEFQADVVADDVLFDEAERLALIVG